MPSLSKTFRNLFSKKNKDSQPQNSQSLLKYDGTTSNSSDQKNEQVRANSKPRLFQNSDYIRTTQIRLNNNDNSNTRHQQTKPIGNLIDLNAQNTYVPQFRTTQDKSLLGGKPQKKHNGKMYVVHTGTRGGKYIIVKGNKVYV